MELASIQYCGNHHLLDAGVQAMAADRGTQGGAGCDTATGLDGFYCLLRDRYSILVLFPLQAPPCSSAEARVKGLGEF